MFWFPQIQNILKLNNFHRGANLTILQVKKEDRGHYVCEASNGIGSVVDKKVLLEVSFGPVLSAKRPKVGQKEGYEARLICKATSYPPASISFVHKGKELSNDQHYQIEYQSSVNEMTEAILILSEVKKHHYGEYECKARNELGDAKTTLELFGKEVINFLFFYFIFFHLFWSTDYDYYVGCCLTVVAWCDCLLFFFCFYPCLCYDFLLCFFLRNRTHKKLDMASYACMLMALLSSLVLLCWFSLATAVNIKRYESNRLETERDYD